MNFVLKHYPAYSIQTTDYVYRRQHDRFDMVVSVTHTSGEDRVYHLHFSDNTSDPYPANNTVCVRERDPRYKRKRNQTIVISDDEASAEDESEFIPDASESDEEKKPAKKAKTKVQAVITPKGLQPSDVTTCDSYWLTPADLVVGEKYSIGKTGKPMKLLKKQESRCNFEDYDRVFCLTFHNPKRPKPYAAFDDFSFYYHPSA